MKVLLTGARGQVGRELAETRPDEVVLSALSRAELDITNERAVVDTVRSIEPDLVINAAAYTAVDEAEADRDSAFAVNATGASNVALAARAVGCRLIHISTDFVFDGAHGSPYRPADPTHPLSAYGRSKLDGEEGVRSVSGDAAVIVRSSWIYSRFGGNFVKTMLRLMAERPKLGVVCDQIGSPTWGRSLATALWEIASRPTMTGTVHWTDAGVASWYDFAVAIQELACEVGLLDKPIPIDPITARAYPTPATRPPFSVLDSSALADQLEIPRRHWREALRLMLGQLAEESDA